MKRIRHTATKTASLAAALAAFFSIATQAQTNPSFDSTADNDTSMIVEPDSVVYNIQGPSRVDSLITAWYATAIPTVNDFVPDSVALADSIIAGIPDSIFIERLQSMMSPIPMVYNEQVRRFIELYVVKRRYLVQRMLGLSKYYFPLFEQTLEAHNMPLELKFLPVIESALNPNALSRAGASGLWQFMYYTGKRYGLDVTSYVDERRDPAKATEAAALFLHDLYVMYGDWHLAIAAYNCGPGNVNRAIARSGGQKSFWKIYYNLPRETRGYVPAFIAAAYAMTYASEHQIYASEIDVLPATDTVQIYQPLNFMQVSSVIGTQTELLRKLNPQYKHDVVPAQDGKFYALALPVETTFAFAANEDSIYARNRKTYFPDNKVVPISESKSGGKYYGATPAGKAKLIYTVKQGDVPGSISHKFGVRLADLSYWNGLRRNIIRVGQKLVIYVPKNNASKYTGIATLAK